MGVGRTVAAANEADGRAERPCGRKAWLEEDGARGRMRRRAQTRRVCLWSGGGEGAAGLRINVRHGGKAAEERLRASRDGGLSVNGGALAAAAKRLGGLGR